MKETHSKIILEKLSQVETATSHDFDIPISELHGTLHSLSNSKQIDFTIKEEFERVLTDEGKSVIENGSQEFNLYNEIGSNGAEKSLLKKYPYGSKYALRERWIIIKEDKIYREKKILSDLTVEKLKEIELLSQKEFEELRKRNLADKKKNIIYIIKKGENFGKHEEFEVELTADMVLKPKDRKFKMYNFNSTGNLPNCGSLHPLLKIREEIKKIFIEMGFCEMSTNRYVESSFWNFDSLFQPQNHPARDSHDTFFLKHPSRTTRFDYDYLQKVKEIHTIGGYGSVGYRSDWSEEEASKNILRTHTTSVSSRYLKKLAASFRPSKFFSIDKVFRNESIDATHLAEFHQVEGMIVDYNIGICHLIGILSAFFKKLGLNNIKFKPAYNPYTEPSMEIFGYHEGLKKWIEIGNSGIFRPEMIRTMGYPEDVCVIAWGLSLERPAMIKYGLNNIRELIGHKVDINFIKKSEFVFY